MELTHISPNTTNCKINADVQNVLDAIHLDVPKEWCVRFAFDRIVPVSDRTDTWFIPCYMKKNHVTFPDILDPRYLYPEWCTYKAMKEFENFFNKKKEYTIETFYDSISEDALLCRLFVTYGNVTIFFRWEQW